MAWRHQQLNRPYDVVIIHDDQLEGRGRAMPVHVRRRMGGKLDGVRPVGEIYVCSGNILAAGVEAAQLLEVDSSFMDRNTTPLVVVIAVGTYGTEMPTVMMTPFNDIVVGHRDAFAFLNRMKFDFPFPADSRDARFYDADGYMRRQRVDAQGEPTGPLRHVQHPIRDAFADIVQNAVTGFTMHGPLPRLLPSQIPDPPRTTVAFDVDANGNIRLWLTGGMPKDEFVDVTIGETSPRRVPVVLDKQVPYAPGTLLLTEGDYGPELLVMRDPGDSSRFPTAAEEFGLTSDRLPIAATVGPSDQLLLW